MAADFSVPDLVGGHRVAGLGALVQEGEGSVLVTCLLAITPAEDA